MHAAPQAKGIGCLARQDYPSCAPQAEKKRRSQRFLRTAAPQANEKILRTRRPLRGLSCHTAPQARKNELARVAAGVDARRWRRRSPGVEALCDSDAAREDTHDEPRMVHTRWRRRQKKIRGGLRGVRRARRQRHRCSAHLDGRRARGLDVVRRERRRRESDERSPRAAGGRNLRVSRLVFVARRRREEAPDSTVER